MAVSAGRPHVGPPVPTPLRYGLLSVAQTPETEDSTHARLGVRFEVGTCDPAEATCDPCLADGSDELPKLATEAKELRGATPFTVYSRPVCSSVGWADEARDAAEIALRRGEARTVERVFWTGDPVTGCDTVTPHLASSVAVTGDAGPGGAAPVLEQTAAEELGSGDPIEVMALLEEALGECYGNEGVIHAPTAVATWWTRFNLLTRDGSRLRSPAGHLVAVGAGYPGTGPSGESGDTRWVFATGAVMLRRSPINLIPTDVQSALNRSRNDIAYVAERTYVIGWDCCHFAADASILLP